MALTLVPNVGGGVYGRARAGVKRVYTRSAITMGLALAAGCAGPPRGASPAPYPVAVSCNVALTISTWPDHSEEVIREDFAHIAQLGFDTVVAGPCPGGSEAVIRQAARREGLTAALAHQATDHYLRTGRLPAGCKSVEDFAGRLAGTYRPGERCYLGSVVDAVTAERARKVATALRGARGSPGTLVLVDGGEVDAAGLRSASMVAWSGAPADRRAAGDLMWLECIQQTDEAVPSAAVRWLRDYHARLADGLTGGVVVSPFRVVPGRWRGLVEGADRDGLDRVTALRRITERAIYWGPRLRRLTPGDVRPLGPASSALRAVVFAGDQRRYVMLFNTSSEHFIRGIVDLPNELGSRPVQRAVPVPSDPKAMAAEVAQPRMGRLPLPVDLAPGDAALWELF